MDKIIKFINKIGALGKRDFLIFMSYRFALFLQIILITAIVIFCYFLSRAIDKTQVYNQILGRQYGTDYFPYLLVGISFYHYFILSTHSFARYLRREEMMGTLEALTVTPTSSSAVILSMAIWFFIRSLIFIMIYFAVGIILFKLNLGNVNILSTIVILILAFFSFAGIGIISASFIVYFKEGDPIGLFILLIGMAFSIFGEAFFPRAMFQPYLQYIPNFLPTTYVFAGMRYALFKGYSLISLKTEIGILLLFGILFFSLGLASFNLAVKKARIDGNLSHY